MANPRRIKVKRVEAADPELRVTMESENTGEPFPEKVKVKASVSWSGNTYPAEGVNPNVLRGTMEVTVDASFTDASYGPGQTLDYVIDTVEFSDDGIIWTPYVGTIENASGSVNTGTGNR